MNRHNFPFLPLGALCFFLLIISNALNPTFLLIIIPPCAFLFLASVLYYYNYFHPKGMSDHPPESFDQVARAKNEFLTNIALIMSAKNAISPNQSVSLRTGRGGYYLSYGNQKTREIPNHISQACLDEIKQNHGLNAPQMRLLSVMMDQSLAHALPVMSAHDIMQAKMQSSQKTASAP